MPRRYVIENDVANLPTVKDGRDRELHGDKQAAEFWRIHAEYWAAKGIGYETRTSEAWAEHRKYGGYHGR